MRPIIKWGVFSIFVIALFAAMAYAEDFNADMVSSSSDGAFTGKLYVSGDKSRMEMPEAISISRMDKKVVWVLMPSENMYMEQPLDMRTAASTRDSIDGEIERKAQGNEIVNGRNTTKYRVIFENNGRRESIFQWIDESVHVPVKTSAVDGSWSSEFRNIRTGPQNPELFMIPKGYTKMSLGMPDMKSIMAAMGEGD
jgi:outer membrane lipoprotein-sorting protein